MGSRNCDPHAASHLAQLHSLPVNSFMESAPRTERCLNPRKFKSLSRLKIVYADALILAKAFLVSKLACILC